MLRVALIDDEDLARQALRQLFATMHGIRIVGEANGIPQALELITREKPDAIFLDIRMPGGDGFRLLRELPNPPRIVFVTAHSEHAAKAFEVDAVDYLLKPVRASRLATTVQRLEIACGRSSEATPLWSNQDRICLNTPERTLIAKVSDLLMLEADGDFTRVFVAGEHPLMICRSLRTYEESLPSPPFVRLDRSLMLNVEMIVRTERVTRDEERIWLRGKTDPVILGRTAKTRLRALTGKF